MAIVMTTFRKTAFLDMLCILTLNVYIQKYFIEFMAVMAPAQVVYVGVISTKNLPFGSRD